MAQGKDKNKNLNEEVAEGQAVAQTGEAGSTKGETTQKKKKPQKLRVLDQNSLVEMKSNYTGILYFEARSGASRKWPAFGMTQYMPVSEVVTMRNEAPDFFRNCWVTPVGDNAQAVIESLQLDRFYGKAQDFLSFDDLVNMPVETLKELVATMSADSVANIARRAYSMVQTKEIDSITRVKELEDALGYTLSE